MELLFRQRNVVLGMVGKRKLDCKDLQSSFYFNWAEPSLSLGKDVAINNGIVTINSAEDLIRLSNCDPKELQSITININVTGQLDTRGTVGGYSFQGIGSKAYPFQGKKK